MIQFNLLPDIKLEYIKARRVKRLVIVVSIIVTAVLVAMTAVMYVVTNVVQPQKITKLSTDIQNKAKTLQNTPDLNKILTIQNQIQSLPALHDKKPIASRLFDDLTQITPSAASISNLQVDFTTGKDTMTLTGNADSIKTINVYVDTFKFTTYTLSNAPTTKVPAFTNVVLSSFSRDSKGASFSISLNFDPILFDATKQPVLNVPVQVTTRSQTQDPTDLFQNLPADAQTPTNTNVIGH